MNEYELQIKALKEKVMADAEEAKKKQLEQFEKNKADIEKLMDLAEKNLVMLSWYKAPDELRNKFRKVDKVKFNAIGEYERGNYIICGVDIIIMALAHKPKYAWEKKFEMKSKGHIYINGIEFILVTEYARYAINQLTVSKRRTDDLLEMISKEENKFENMVKVLDVLKENVNFEDFDAYKDYLKSKER